MGVFDSQAVLGEFIGSQSGEPRGVSVELLPTRRVLRPCSPPQCVLTGLKIADEHCFLAISKDPPVAQDQLPASKDHRWTREHRLWIVIISVDRHIGNGTWVQVTSVLQAQRPSRSESRDRGNLVEPVLPLETRQG